MDYRNEEKRLLKFLATSSAFLFIGTVHGVLQVIRPIREYLDSIGSPYGGPGHLIDPLAHAHINVIGGVIMIVFAASYYFMPRITSKPLWSYKLLEHTYWWTTIGVISFYSTLLIYGIWEGNLLLADDVSGMEQVHKYYSRTIAIAATVMGMGFWLYFANIFMTFKNVRKS
ncbi:MAG: cbb3-type cytochrome c oxidase subunit I [Gammaproteobacteria bacterium]|nr:cbb3-type cytochrome c oxidase subunit I [Gammaproteobacteria bacterium]